MAQSMSDDVRYNGPSFFSYGFRPFFLSAAVFAGIAIPVWVFMVNGTYAMEGIFPPRVWHMHEMIFGFLPCVITGFLLTAMPNWTERSPMRGAPLMWLCLLWVVGRMVITFPWFSLLASALIDSAFLIVMAGIVWRELITSKAWERLPIGVLITLYACANLLFHWLWMNHDPVDVAVRMALTMIMILLALIGGKITPSFTEDILTQEAIPKQPAPFSPFDGLSILVIGATGVAWMISPEAQGVGYAFIFAGILHCIRLSRWYGWLTWREPLVLILHVGYGWLAMSLLILGAGILGLGVHQEDALHALTTGAVGAMTLAVMTRASLGHTGRIKHAGSLTVMIYLLVNLGAILRVFGPSLELLSDHSLTLAAGCWSGAYLLFAMGYGHILLEPNVDEA